MTGRPGTGLGIDQPEPRFGQSGEVRDDVVRAVRDVVQAGAPSCEEAPYGRVGTQGFEQLHRADEGHANALVFQHLDGGTSFPREEFVHDCALLERVNGDGHVIERPIAGCNGYHQRPAPEGAVRVNGPAEHRTVRP